jgi:hypothetical protein
MMGIREWMNQHRGVTMGIVATIVLVAVGAIVAQVLANRKTYPSASPDSFFTVDDGKSFFVASSDNIPPFDYKGKPAVHAYVFQSGGKKFVGYMERYTPEARQTILAGKRSPQIERFGRELKKPGVGEWVKSGDLMVESKISDVRSPDGHGVPEAIEP